MDHGIMMAPGALEYLQQVERDRVIADLRAEAIRINALLRRAHQIGLQIKPSVVEVNPGLALIGISLPQ